MVVVASGRVVVVVGAGTVVVVVGVVAGGAVVVVVVTDGLAVSAGVATAPEAEGAPAVVLGWAAGGEAAIKTDWGA